MMKRITFLIFIPYLMIGFLFSCAGGSKGDEYYSLAKTGIDNDSMVHSYSMIEKALEEYRKAGDKEGENRSKLFLSLLYFSTNQKEKAYDIVKDMDACLNNAHDYPLYSNYYRIKAFYKSNYEKKPSEALALMDSVLRFDSEYAKNNEIIQNIDRLNKCEILLNNADTTDVGMLITSVIASTKFPSALEPQIYANLARLYETLQVPDSAYKYAKLTVEKTSKIHEDIDNDIFAINIILRYDSANNNLTDYIHYRDMMQTLIDSRQGERIKYEMAFAKEQNINENLRLNSKTEKLILTLIILTLLLLTVTVSLFLIHKRKDALAKSEITQLECDRLDAEAFRRKLENELLMRKINSKSEELAKANEEILELSQQLAQKKQNLPYNDTLYLQRLLAGVATRFPDFQTSLTANYPDITKTEAILACLIKYNLTSEEITTAMSISKAGLIKARYRLRKRLGIESSAELDNFIADFQ